MNNMTLEKIKNVLFNEIDLSFANDKLIIKLDKVNEIKNKFQMRFILSGGTIMTIFSTLQKVSAGAGVCGLHGTNDSGA